MLSGQLNKDKIAELKATPEILFKANPNSHSLRATVITSNAKKFEEFAHQLGDGYGMDVSQHVPAAELNLDNEETLTELCFRIMQNEAHSPHFILREETKLISQKTQKDLTHLSLEELAKLKLESVLHISTLTVYKPQWQETPDKKQLTVFTVRQYERRSYGYIHPAPASTTSSKGFGWDALFVNAATNLTNEAFFKLYGKKSARQHTISDFIETYLRYKALKTLQHHHLPVTRAIDFGAQFISVAQFVRNEKHMSNPFINDWGIADLRNAMINRGVFYKAATDRPVGNYFCPPFSGLPLTPKKDDAEETIFMTHDILHHLVCDLVCDHVQSKENFYIYHAWRMMSEACTLVLADMLYADGLIKSGVARACVDKRIYPLFEAIKQARQIPYPCTIPLNDKIAFIKRLLRANVQYALLGDDSYWRELLKVNGTIEAEHLAALNAYKAHFAKFFIGDNAWTRANYDNMGRNAESIHTWINNIERETFRSAHIPLLSDVRGALENRSVRLNRYEDVVNSLFEYMFEKEIQPLLRNRGEAMQSDFVLQSRAFKRFLIGQCSIFSRYPTPLNLNHVKEKILDHVRLDKLFSNERQDGIRNLLTQYILGIEGLRLMSREEALNAIDCTPVFPPVYISYDKMQKRFHSIENCVQLCVKSFGEPTAEQSQLFTPAPPAVTSTQLTPAIAPRV